VSASGAEGERARAPGESADEGERLWALAPRLRLLLQHLAGPALRRRVELEDLLQETFLRVWTAPGGLPVPEARDAALWRALVRVARQASVDAARASRARKRDARVERLVRSDWSRVGVRASELAAREWGPATRAAAAESEAALQRAFNALAPEHRRVIGLRQLEGLSAAAVARRMGRSESAVHSLYRRALLAWERGAR